MLERVVFIGSKLFGFRCLQACEETTPNKIQAILTLDDSNDDRSALYDFEKLAKERNIPLHILESPKKLEGLIEELQPELGIVVGWYWIMRKELIERVPHGFVGLHASLLPKYRGSAPLVWAIINGETEAGVSLFYFSKGIDDGDIVASAKFNIQQDETIKEAADKAMDCSVRIFREFYPKLLAGTALREPQEHSQATYCAQRIPEDGKIDWSWSARNIYNFIRAQSHPYPGAFTILDNKQLKVWHASFLEKVYYGTPGQVAEINPRGVVVTCGDNRGVILHKVQLGNDNERHASEVIRINKTRFSMIG